MKRVDVLGIPFVSASSVEWLSDLEGRIDAGERNGICVVPVNAQLSVLHARQPEFADVISRAEYVLPDGMPLVWISRFAGTPLRQRLRGADAFPQMCELAARRGWSVFLIGDTDEVLRDTVKRLEGAYPGIRIAGWHSPSFPFDVFSSESAEVAQRVRASGADVVFIGLGAPRQELWTGRYRSYCGARIIQTVGSSYRFYIGRLHSAPRLLQLWGLEWLWRLLQEPRRLWYRYTVQNVQFMMQAVRWLWRGRRGKGSVPPNESGE